MYFLFTNDVETTSLELNRPIDSMAIRIKKIGMPRVLDLCSKFDVKATFFFTADIVNLEPSLIDNVKANGHEIGCHGLTHNDEYDKMPFKEQLTRISKAKEIIERQSNQQIVSFRSPEARINEDTIKVLDRVGFKYDSSICPQRFDGPLSKGFKKKIFWMIAPRRPYMISNESVVNPGNTKIMEIPISALVFPFVGSTLRASPQLFRLLRKLILYESQKGYPPVVFVFHPTECIEIDNTLLNSNSQLQGGIFAGIVRKRIKLRNLGRRTVNLMEDLLRAVKSEGYEFISVRDYGVKYKQGIITR